MGTDDRPGRRGRLDAGQTELLAAHFERDRPRLRRVAYRILGSPAEADDAVQEAWIRVTRGDSDGIENLSAWLTTVVARVCLNMLRTRRVRPSEPLAERLDDPPDRASGSDPEAEAVLGDSVGLALLVVLDSLTPAERLAFVLHDMFGLPFDEIAKIIERSPAAARQLASRARRRVRGSATPEPDVDRQQRVVDAYLAATRSGDFQALLNILDPDVVLRTDAGAAAGGISTILRGDEAVAHGAMASAGRARRSELALIDGSIGIVMRSAAHVTVALKFTMVGEHITRIDVVSDDSRLRNLHITPLLPT